MQILFNEISHFVSQMKVSFQHISRYAEGMADSLAKNGADDHSCNLSASIM